MKTLRQILAFLLVLLGAAGAAISAGVPDPTGIVETARQADALTDRGLFLASLLIMLAGFCLAGREILKRLDSREAALAESQKVHRDFLEARHAEAVATIDANNAISLKTNELLDKIDTRLRNP